MSCSVTRVELRIPSARGKGPYAPGDGVWSMVNPGERVEGYARRVTAPGQARQTGESRVSRSEVPGDTADQRAGGDTARWVRIITCQTADCGNSDCGNSDIRHRTGDIRHVSTSGDGMQNAPPATSAGGAMFFPDSDRATNSQRVRPPDAAPVLTHRLSCTYMVSFGFGRSVTHPMGAHEAAARWRVPARRVCVRSSRWKAIMESWAPSESERPDQQSGGNAKSRHRYSTEQQHSGWAAQRCRFGQRCDNT
jgi:hypothetical protein